MLALSPLAGHECRWAVSRKWVFVVRSIAAAIILGVLAVACWLFWFLHEIKASTHPGIVIGGALHVAVVLNLTFVLFLAPALMAGSFSSDPTRSALGILLITKVNAGEIVFSRFASRVCQVALVAAAGLPGIFFLAGYCNVGFTVLLSLILFMFSVACGAGSIALLFSVLFTRARDALIGTYAVGLALLLIPVLFAGSSSPAIEPWIATLNPYRCLLPLINSGYTAPAMRTALTWLVLAVLCNALTTWLLWPSYLRRASGVVSQARRARGIPPVDDNPIHWKELYIESHKDFGRVLRTIGRVTLFVMLGGSAALTVLYLWSELAGPAPQLVEDILFVSSDWLQVLTLPMSWMLQWGVGIRAAAGISTEKEQGTWDTLMMTPLEGREIVKAKIYVGYYSLRWFLAATLIVWLLAVMLDSISLYDFAMLVLTTTFFVGLTSALGVWSSLNAKTSGRAIALTLLQWLGAKIGILIASFMLVAITMLIILLFFAMLDMFQSGVSPRNSLPPVSLETGLAIYQSLLCLGGTLLISWYGGKRFDRLAGRGFNRRKPVAVRVA